MYIHGILHSNIHGTFYIQPFYSLSKSLVYLAHCVVVIGICREQYMVIIVLYELFSCRS